MSTGPRPTLHGATKEAGRWAIGRVAEDAAGALADGFCDKGGHLGPEQPLMEACKSGMTPHVASTRRGMEGFKDKSLEALRGYDEKESWPCRADCAGAEELAAFDKELSLAKQGAANGVDAVELF